MILTKRAYEPADKSDGERFLIDRLWPRGVTRDALQLTGWLKELAPSDGLRKWYGHEPAKFPEFRRRYRGELLRQPDALARLRERGTKGTVTLVYGARDGRLANAAVLSELLAEDAAPGSSRGADHANPPRRARR